MVANQEEHSLTVISRKAPIYFVLIALAALVPPIAAFAQSNTPDINATRSKLLAENARVVDAGPFQPNWKSLETYKIPEWYQDAKFGIFIHWGVYSVPAFGTEWYPRTMYLKGSTEYNHQVALHGPETEFGYKDYIPLFRAEHFDPAAWAQLFRDAGARYVVPVAEHHDGFAMYNSDLSEWTAVKMGPKQDVIGELAKAVRARGLHFGLSSHREEHYWYYNGGFDFPSDVQSQKYTSLYGFPPSPGEVHNNTISKDTTVPPKAFLDDWLARDTELVNKYHPEVIYFDWWIGKPQFQPYLQRFAAFYYNYAAAHGFPPVLNYKNTAMPEGAGVFDVERGELAGIRQLHWQTDTSVGNKSWGYIQDDTYKSPEFIVHELADVVSKNGNLLLNIGPKPDGTIPTPVRQTLLAVGTWLRVNGEAIYNTRPWTQYGEGTTEVEAGSFHDTHVQNYTPTDFRFTRKGNTLYAIELARPAGSEAVIHALSSGSGNHVKSMELLGIRGNLKWRQKADGLHIDFPATSPDEYAYAYRITLKQAQN